MTHESAITWLILIVIVLEALNTFGIQGVSRQIQAFQTWHEHVQQLECAHP